MTTITTEVATAQRWDDVVQTMTGGGDGKTCWCQWWYIPNKDWNATPVDEREARLRSELEGPPRALVAYVDGEAAGWCRVSPRGEQIRLLRSQVLGASDIPADEPDVWAVSCVIVRKEYRGQGVATSMIGAAIDLARSEGAAALEAYPIDTRGARKSSNGLFHGTLAMFTEAGFHETGRANPSRPVVRLDLDDAPSPKD